MPVTNISLLRRAYSNKTQPTPEAGDAIPDYSVLFYYAKPGRWNSDIFGSLNSQNYRIYSEIVYNTNSIKSNPLIRCIENDFGWKDGCGKCYAATTTIPTTSATLLEKAGAHLPLQFSRPNQPLGYGFKAGDTASATATYYDLNNSYSGHTHSVADLSVAFTSPAWGELKKGLSAATSGGDYEGVQHVAVVPLLKDPNIGTGTHRLGKLPKNVIVFGSSLPSPDYTKDDDLHRLSAAGYSLPILARSIDVGAPGSASYSITTVSNTAGAHTHSATAVAGVVPTKAASNKTGQTAYIFNRPPGAATTGVGPGMGDHIHAVQYDTTLVLKAKELSAYITTLDETPLADGVIIAYSIGTNTGYSGGADGPDLLPANWYFCDGQNGTPDLRGYYIYANFRDTAFDAELDAGPNRFTVDSITIELAGDHGHAGDPNPSVLFSGTDKVSNGLGSAIDIGAHGYETSTAHTHNISTAQTFKVGTTTYTNFKVGSGYNFDPPTVDLAFIQYKAP